MDMLTILNKSGIMYRFASEFESLVMMMSAQTGGVGAGVGASGAAGALDEAAREKYKFHFAYRTAGFWHVTEVWSREEPRRSPEEMAKVMLEITSFPSEVHIL